MHFFDESQHPYELVAKIRDALQDARAEIEAEAAEATQEMVSRLTGIQIEKNEAAKAVKAELHV